MSGRPILVIEDDALNRKLLRTLLTLGRYAVLEAVDAESGIPMARESLPQCILMDIRLPGMDGLAATRSLKADASLRSIPVVAVTAVAMNGEERKALDAGCDGYITKPIDTRAFLDNIRQFLSKACPVASPAEPLESGLPRVLVVDDDEPIRRLSAGYLQRDGFAVIEACDGREALVKAHEECPDLILLDVGMPGMDGYEVTRRLKGNLGTLAIPIILVTGLSDSNARLKGLESGADEFLAKPVDTVELLVRIKAMIRLKSIEERLSRRARAEEALGALPPLEEPSRGEARPPVVLVAEQDEEAALRIRAALEEAGCTVTRTRDDAETLAVVGRQGVDILLLSTALPDTDPFDLCRLLKEEEATRNLQVIMVSPRDEPGRRVASLQRGADDYLALPLDALELTVRVKLHAKRKARLDALQARCQSAMNAAANDGLTGLANNTAFKRFLDLELKRSQRHAHPGALLFLDVDDFKHTNDTQGHLMGDLVLSELAQILKGSIRDIDLAARYGGEEFAVLLPHTDDAGARIVAERLRSAVEAHRFLSGASAEETVTVSVGVACFPAEAVTPEDLIRRADARLYRAKREGKNRVCASDGPSAG